ncbi:MAG: galactofuranosyltransferase [Prevotella sp.]
MNRLCYISRCYHGVKSSGSKARTDNEDIITGMGGVNLGLRRSFHTGKVLTFLLNFSGIIKYIFSVRKGDIIFLQYPIKKYFAFICKVASLRGARTVTLIHDLGSFRRKKLTTEKEIGRLSHTDYVIASNDVMARWLADKGLKKPLGALGLFDYQSDDDNEAHTPYVQGRARLVYAGALAMRKTSFMLSVPEVIKKSRLHVYGDRSGLPGMPDSEVVEFHGFLPADEFIRTVDADFGLVWDGDSLDSCTGNFGEYLQYNTPHKVSFYIRAGLPVAIWREAALAKLVERENIGICIDTLHGVDEVLAGITAEQYAVMRDNVRKVCRRMKEGGFLREAIEKACSTFS